jgi:acetolactate synthase-1/2/3 large subunit
MKKRVADIIMEILCENSITDCFAVVGGGAMHLNNALALNKNINKYFNHHEQACAMAAEAYARVSGRIAAVCVTSGPGGTNALTGVMGCYQDSLPMVVISGQVRYAISIETAGVPLRYRGIQEFDIINSIQNMTKYAKMVIDPLSIRRELQKAIDISLSGRRGPVWLDIPMDIQSAVIEENDLYPIEESVVPVSRAKENDIEELYQIIKRKQLKYLKQFYV